MRETHARCVRLGKVAVLAASQSHDFEVGFRDYKKWLKWYFFKCQMIKTAILAIS